jgi:hypothetical protein
MYARLSARPRIAILYRFTVFERIPIAERIRVSELALSVCFRSHPMPHGKPKQ